MGDKIFIMNFDNEQVGSIERTPDEFIQDYNGKITSHNSLPPVMRGIAPEPTQFPAANYVLEYYKLERLDVWEYLKRSNGFKNSREVWFMSEPVGETWIPLVIGMQKYGSYNSWFKINDKMHVQINGFANVNRHSIDILPPCIIPYLQKSTENRFSTAEGYVYDLADWPSVRGLIGRLIINFPPVEKS